MEKPEEASRRAQLAEKILLAFVNKLPFDMLTEIGQEKAAEGAVKQADALFAALERK